MRNIFIIGLLSIVFAANVHAQDLNKAKEAIEAEQYEKAKGILRSLTALEQIDGESHFRLGNLYLTLKEQDSARLYFQKGITFKENAKLNYIGLGQIDLDNDDKEAAEANFEKALHKIRRKDTKELVYIARAYTKSDHPDYDKAVEYAKRALAIDPKLAEAYLVLGDAEYGKSNVNEAYSAYRNAFDLDNTFLRAKLQLAIITKGSKAFPDAVQALNDIIASNPDYGPAYRELAETYYLWATTDKAKYKEYIDKSLGYYEKYMNLTDYSLDSRMRHADFLILTKDYAALQKEAIAMQKIDKVNARILRYLGYSAYENGNYMDAIIALNDFITKVDPKRLLPMDYLYLAKASWALSVSEDGTVKDSVQFDATLGYLAMAYEKKAPVGDEFREMGATFYRAKNYAYVQKLLGVIIQYPQATLLDNFYFANAVFYDVAAKAAAAAEEEEVVVRGMYQDLLKRADSAYAFIIENAPNTQDAYFNRARLNRYIISEQAEENVAIYFEQYAEVVTAKGETELEKPTVIHNLSEAYTSIGAYYAEIDPEKAIVNFEKAVALDPTNEHAAQSLEFLKKKK